MNTYRIFIASSFRLKDERKALEIEVGRLNDEFSKRHVYLKADIWEKFDAANDPERKQNFYNEYIRKADLFLVIYQGELGAFTREEFQQAQALFTETGRPRLYLFKKKGVPDHQSQAANVQNLQELETLWYTKDKEQWPWEFDNKEGLIKKVADDIRALFANPNLPYFSFPEVKKLSLNSPEMPVDFLGREEELKTIYEKLNSGGKLMLINAEGGIGKTTLAAKYWNEALNNYKYAAWLFCEGGIVNSLKELAPQLNIDLNGMDEQQQIQAMKLGLAAVQNDFLLVLDNANNEDDIRLFRQEFEGFHWHVLITSRCQGVLSQEQELPITHLPPPLAKALFTRHYREEREEFEELLDRVLLAINYHTLLTEVFAKNLAEAAELEAMDLGIFLNKLENGGLYLREHSFEIENNEWAIKRKLATTDQILDALYDFSQLTEEQRFLIVNISLLPAEPYSLHFLNSLLAKEPERTARQLRDTLKRLVRKGWISEADRSYRISPVIQKLVLVKHAETLSGDSIDLLERLNYITETDTHNLIRTSLKDAASYIQPVHHINQYLNQEPGFEISVYNHNSAIYYTNIGDLVNANKIYIQNENIYLALLKLDPGNIDVKNFLGVLYNGLAQTYGDWGDLELQLVYINKSHEIAKEVIQNSPETLLYQNNLAQSYSSVGKIHETTGDMEQALVNYQKANEIIQSICKESPETPVFKNNLAFSYSNLGRIYEYRKDWKNALPHYIANNEITQEVYENNRETLIFKNNLAESFSSLGRLYKACNDNERAEINFKRHHEIAKELCEEAPGTLMYKNNLAISYVYMGEFYSELNEWEKSEPYLIEAKRLTKELVEESNDNLLFKNNYSYACQNLGDFYRFSGDLDNAISNFKEGQTILSKIHESSRKTLLFKNNLALSYSRLGDSYKEAGDNENALFYLKEYNRLIVEVANASSDILNSKNNLAESYFSLGDFYSSVGDSENAILNFLENIKILTDTYQHTPELPEFKKNLAGTYFKLGSVYEILADWPNVLINYRENLRIRKEIYENAPGIVQNKELLESSYLRLGNIYSNSGDFKNALENYWEYQMLHKGIGQELANKIRSFRIVNTIIKTIYFTMKVTNGLEKSAQFLSRKVRSLKNLASKT